MSTVALSTVAPSCTPSTIESAALQFTPAELAILTDPAHYREFEPPFRIDVEGVVTFRDGAHGHLAPDTEALARALIADGAIDCASRIAGCHTHGTVIAECECGRYAQAIRHCCGSPLCRNCGRSFYQYLQWSKTRDLAHLESSPQLGIELIAPYPTGAVNDNLPVLDRPATEDQGLPAGPVPPMRRRVLPYKTPRQVEAGCSYIAERAKRFAKSLAGSTIAHDWIDPLGVNCRIRLAVEGPGAALQFKTLRKMWRRIVPDGEIEIHRGTGVDILQWIFQGYMPLLMLPGEDRARYHSLFGCHAHHTRSTGKFYSCLPKAELVRRAVERRQHASGCICPSCKHPIEIKAVDDQHSEPRDVINARYERVDWVRFDDPIRVIRVHPITDKSDDDAPDDAPRSRYGPS